MSDCHDIQVECIIIMQVQTSRRLWFEVSIKYFKWRDFWEWFC